MTEAEFSKILIQEEKPIADFAANWVNQFRHPELFSNPPAHWLEVVMIWATSKREMVGVHVFDRANPSVCTTGELAGKEDLNTRKQVLLFDLSLRLSQKTRIQVIFYEEMLMQEVSVVQMLRSLEFQVSTFPCLVVVSISLCI